MKQNIKILLFLGTAFFIQRLTAGLPAPLSTDLEALTAANGIEAIQNLIAAKNRCLQEAESRKEHITELEQAEKNYQAALSKATLREEGYRKKEADQEDQIERLKAELAQIKIRIEEQEKALLAQDTHIATLVEQIQNLESILDPKNLENEDLKAALTSQELTCKRLKEELTNCQADCNTLTETLGSTLAQAANERKQQEMIKLEVAATRRRFQRIPETAAPETQNHPVTPAA